MKSLLKQRLVGQDLNTVIVTSHAKDKRIVHMRAINGIMDEIVMVSNFWVEYFRPMSMKYTKPVMVKEVKTFDTLNEAVDFYETV